MSVYYYPYNYLNYNTLNIPSTFTNTCFPLNCPQPAPYSDRIKNNREYVDMLTKRYEIGLKRYLDSRQPGIFDNLNNYPVYNSNMAKLPSNYMNYKSM